MTKQIKRFFGGILLLVFLAYVVEHGLAEAIALHVAAFLAFGVVWVAIELLTSD